MPTGCCAHLRSASSSRALIDAALISGEFGASDRDSVRHIQRVAALNVAKRYEVDVTNREEVVAAYATLRTPALPRAPIATIFASCAVAVSVLLLVWLAITIRTPSRPHAAADARRHRRVLSWRHTGTRRRRSSSSSRPS